MYDIGMFRIGFELEYQSTDIGGEASEEALSNWRDNEYDNISQMHLYDYSPIHSYVSFRNISNPEEYISIRIPRVADAIEHDILSLEDVYSLIDTFDPPDDLEKELDLPSPLKRVDDGSVSGGEIKPSKALTYDEAIKALQDLDRDIGITALEVDKQCSFHVHLSILNVNHVYGENLQGWATQYIIDHLIELPTNVLERWDSKNKSWMNSYFCPQISDSKYSFVSYCGRLKTWEFRCFGNVQSVAEGQACIDMAIKAFTYAKMQIENKQLYSKTSSEMFDEVVSTCDKILAERNQQQAVGV